MTAVDSVALETPDPAAAEAFYAAFGVSAYVDVRPATASTSGFRGFTLSLVVPQPGNVDRLLTAALDAGATELKPAKKSFWGYGGVIAAPDGAIWKVATSSKKDKAPVSPRFDDVVLLLGVADVKASKRFYVERGLAVGKSFGSKYVEFDLPSSPVKLALYGRPALAKDAGVAADGAGAHGIVLNGAAEPFTDPDGFAWEAATA